MGSKTYVKETIKKVEKLFETLKKEQILMVKGNHSEDDDTALLGPSDRELYQMLIGMARWASQIGRMEIMCKPQQIKATKKMTRTRRLRLQQGVVVEGLWLLVMVRNTVKIWKQNDGNNQIKLVSCMLDNDPLTLAYRTNAAA